MNIMETEDGNALVSIPIRFQTVCGRRRLVVAGQGEVNDINLDESGTLIRLFARAKTLPDDFSTERLFNIKSDLWSEQEREIGLA